MVSCVVYDPPVGGWGWGSVVYQSPEGGGWGGAGSLDVRFNEQLNSEHNSHNVHYGIFP